MYWTTPVSEIEVMQISKFQRENCFSNKISILNFVINTSSAGGGEQLWSTSFCSLICKVANSAQEQHLWAIKQCASTLGIAEFRDALIYYCLELREECFFPTSHDVAFFERKYLNSPTTSSVVLQAAIVSNNFKLGLQRTNTYISICDALL